MCSRTSDADHQPLAYWHLFSIAVDPFFHYLRVATPASITFSFVSLRLSLLAPCFPFASTAHLFHSPPLPNSLPILFLLSNPIPIFPAASHPLISSHFDLFFPSTSFDTSLHLSHFARAPTRPFGALADPTRAAPSPSTPH